MCGRFTQTRSWQEIVELYKITEGFDRDGYPEHRYNIAPTQEVATIRLGRNSQGRALAVMRWGLIPAWAEDPRIGSRMINALAETIEAKPAFGAALRERRCLVVADGFYEWQKQLSGGKQPYHVSPAEGPFAFAGLWERWRGPGKELIKSCTIITTGAAPAVARIHDRMPLILRPDVFDVWLDPMTDLAHACGLLHSFAGALRVVPVARHVNDVRNDDVACMEPLSPCSAKARRNVRRKFAHRFATLADDGIMAREAAGRAPSVLYSWRASVELAARARRWLPRYSDVAFAAGRCGHGASGCRASEM